MNILENKDRVKLKIEYSKYEWLKKIALKNLGITNINRLRDRFDGQSYFNKFLIRSYSEIAFEKYLNREIIDLNLKESEKNYAPSFFSDGKKITLFSYTFGEYPKIEKQIFDIGVFILVNLEYRTAEIIGFLPSKQLLQFIDNKQLTPMDERIYYGIFRDFKQLQAISELNLQ